jgi:origin recognition complex subunit 2
MSQHPLYADWNYTLRHGFNLLVHGPGSKRTLLNTFASMYTHNMHAVCVDAYKPKLDLKAILTSICTDILMLERIPARKNMPQDSIDVEQTSAAFDKILHLVELIRAHTSHATEFCLVIHNIDGAELQNAQAQLALSMLADNRFVHIIASADNVNAQLCKMIAPTHFLSLLSSVEHHHASKIQMVLPVRTNLSTIH